MDRPAADAVPNDDPATPDAEQAERLSRAARDVVHQPADPRLEKAFGHLGLFPEPNAPDAPERPGTPVTPDEPARPPQPRPDLAGAAVPAPAPVDLGPLREELAAMRASVERLDKRLGTVIGLLGLVAVMVAIVAVLVIVRG